MMPPLFITYFLRVHPEVSTTERIIYVASKGAFSFLPLTILKPGFGSTSATKITNE